MTRANPLEIASRAIARLRGFEDEPDRYRSEAMVVLIALEAAGYKIVDSPVGKHTKFVYLNDDEAETTPDALIARGSDGR